MITVAEFYYKHYRCPFCCSDDIYLDSYDFVFPASFYKCPNCGRKGSIYEEIDVFETLEKMSDYVPKVDYVNPEKLTHEDIEQLDNAENLMVSKKKYDDLLEKHLSECRQIAKYDAEIKELKALYGIKNMDINEQ